MQIKQSGSLIEIKGIIKKIEEAEQVISAINNVDSNLIHIKIYDSYVLPSSIIGNLLKLSESGKTIKIGVKDELLLELLQELNLDKKFDIYKF